ncbi:MAG: hypothetical protein K0S34_592 [Bacillales bacterium]|jgi:hypothetical protein|nr:hypothetical protein [Bacillales bacterium]
MKKTIGKYMIFASFALFIVPLAVPFFALTTKIKVIFVSVAVIFAEILFWIGVLFIGHELASKYRTFLNPFKWFKNQNKTDKED